MSKSGLAPRRAALLLLDKVTGEGLLLPESLSKTVEHLAPEDRARAQRLAVTTLRWMDRADRMLGPYLTKRPPPTVLNALRLGVVEIAVDGAAAHGVVDAAVTLVREGPHTKALSGLVNAVLRKVAGDVAKWGTLPIPRLPKWLRAPLIQGYGKTVVEAMERAHSQGAPLDITPRAGSAEELATLLGGIALPTGTVRLGDRQQVSALSGYDTGDWWVQDAAAALPARVLAVQPGETVLDMCAAPGGKTLQMAATGAHVTALDIAEGRMGRLRENLARTGLKADLVVADALNWQTEQRFDAILLDAPCSATGTIRRHPDLPYAKDGAEFEALFTLQEQLLDHALTLLKPGGRLMYCTCSLLPDEGEVQIEEALARHDGLTLDLEALRLPGIEPAWIDDLGLRLRPDYWPDVGGMDGFFLALVRKPASTGFGQ